MSATRTAAASSASSIPRYRAPALTSRLPPPKLPLFRSVVAHPPAPWATQQGPSAAQAQASESQQKDVKGKGKAKGKADKSSTTSPSSATVEPSRPLVGPSQIIYSTAPRPLIPLTSSPFNHKLWNPPAPDSAHRGVLEKDESGRMARFEAMFGDAFGTAETVGAGEGDKSLMEGDGSGRALGQVVGKEHLQKAKRVKPAKGRR
ncbi:hypothetical protein JCM10908_001401 [Rhodotorula pacifica]|uniref:uncharacterized protein n=1 Tax=Rhodotorula pacifica TaxID=1495444 RepID=UPI00317B1710